MVKTLKTFTLSIFAGINIFTVIVMIVFGYAYHLSPVQHPWFSNLGLFFPIPLIINVAFLLFWIIFKLKGILISIIGFMLCLSPIRTYLPLNFKQEPPEGSIKVISYNVYLFAPWDVKKDEPNPILEYLRNSDADIICLQEADTYEMGSKMLHEALEIYPYRDSTKMTNASEIMMLFSKHPILSKKRIKYKSVGNMSLAYILQVNGDSVIVINNHLETNNISMEEREEFQEMIKGNMSKQTIESKSKSLLRKMTYAAQRRAPQSEAVHDFIQKHSDKSIIVCGDFNDNPLSYTHHMMTKKLTDCFTASGNGPGFTYTKNGMLVRIDYIFCSKDWQPYACMVDKSVDKSDHYPICCWLKKRGKP